MCLNTVRWLSRVGCFVLFAQAHLPTTLTSSTRHGLSSLELYPPWDDIRRAAHVQADGLTSMVEVRASPIHGRGVFALSALEAGDDLGEVYGRPGPRRADHGHGDVIRISGVYSELDLHRCRECIWWYLNDGGAESNTQFRTADLALWPTVVVTRRIEPGEELLVEYGPEYWP